MSWIDEIEVGEADGRLQEMYAELVKKRGKVSNILKVHSLNPEALGNHLDLYMTLMFGKSGLSRLEREAIAVVVSAANDRLPAPSLKKVRIRSGAGYTSTTSRSASSSKSTAKEYAAPTLP